MALALAGACRTTPAEEGGSIDLRAEAPEYYRAIERRINGNWGRNRGGASRQIAEAYDRSAGGIVVVSFSIGSRGEILGEPGVEESSGSAFLDGEAVRAVTSAAPFPPLPGGLDTRRVDLLWRFEHIPVRGPSR
jgi:TonB family protein